MSDGENTKEAQEKVKKTLLGVDWWACGACFLLGSIVGVFALAPIAKLIYKIV